MAYMYYYYVAKGNRQKPSQTKAVKPSRENDRADKSPPMKTTGGPKALP
jgi:hypothetical protein